MLGLRLSVLLLFTVSVAGYPDGAPDSACMSMHPQHLRPMPSEGLQGAQTSDPPNRLTLQTSTYTAGKPVQVKIEGPQFMGFLLQARKVDGSDFIPVGNWTWKPRGNFKLMNCSNVADSVTHVMPWQLEFSAFIWNPPAKVAGGIVFEMTVAQTKNIFWTGIKSSTITADYPAQTTEAAKTDTEGNNDNPAQTTEAGKTEGNDDKKKPEDMGNSNVGSPLSVSNISAVTVLVVGSWLFNLILRI